MNTKFFLILLLSFKIESSKGPHTLTPNIIPPQAQSLEQLEQNVAARTKDIADIVNQLNRPVIKSQRLYKEAFSSYNFNTMLNAHSPQTEALRLFVIQRGKAIRLAEKKCKSRLDQSTTLKIAQDLKEKAETALRRAKLQRNHPKEDATRIQKLIWHGSPHGDKN